ncbi:MAG: hypothetical protein ABSF79_11735 [Smithellaceae bacterium]|jgi:hypothetical protein
MNNAFRLHFAADNGLQGLPDAIGHDFRVNHAIAEKYLTNYINLAAEIFERFMRLLVIVMANFCSILNAAKLV